MSKAERILVLMDRIDKAESEKFDVENELRELVPLKDLEVLRKKLANGQFIEAIKLIINMAKQMGLK